MPFSYLIDKIRDAEFEAEPFQHLSLSPFLSDSHFSQIIRCPEVNISDASSDQELFEKLFDQGYEIIQFGGSTKDWKKYVKWRSEGNTLHRDERSLWEGYGVTLRLAAPKSALMSELIDFLAGEEFTSALIEKFSIRTSDCLYDGGVQKYLDGYGINPHPDIRRKALTYMVNINPAPGSEGREHHTHYMKMKPEYEYVRAFWDGNPDLERCHVPWDWCETVKEQRENNSAVIFAPNNQTMHAVDANYDHLNGQRTQLYGNLWYKDVVPKGKADWRDLDIQARTAKARGSRAVDLVKSVMPAPALRFLRETVLRRGDGGVN